MASKRIQKLLTKSKTKPCTGIKKYDNSQRSKSQPLIHQFLKKSKHQNKKIPAPSTIKKKISLYTSPYQNITQCPMCCKQLNALSVSHRDLHVNMCLDLAFNAPTININNNNTNNSNNSNNSTANIPKYVKKSLNIQPLKRSQSASINSNTYWNRKKKSKNRLNRYYSTSSVVNNGVNSLATSAKQTKKEFYYKYKLLDSTNIIIDGFAGAAKFAPKNAIYFLTHFHSDHYKGLTKNFNFGLIYCSEITSRLIYSQIGVYSNIIRPLEMYKKCFIEHSVPESYVTLLDANHCPGAVMFLFEIHLNNEIKYHLHIGDARCEFESNSLFYQNNYNILSHYYGKIDKLYLDTTYLESKMELPRQSDAIQFIANKCKMYMNDYNNDLLILIGTYSIGKERVLKEVAKECNKKIFISNNKQHIFNAVYGEDNNSEQNIFTNDETNTNIYVVSMREISFGNMWNYKKTFSKIIAFRPTGWASKNGGGYKKRDDKHVMYPIYSDNTRYSMVIYEVPYSEHSSFMELCKFVKDINPKEIVPTVGNSTVYKVKSQLEILNKYKDKIKCEYHPLIEDNGMTQTTLENYNFSQQNVNEITQ